jgi:hypothetical protein
MNRPQRRAFLLTKSQVTGFDRQFKERVKYNEAQLMIGMIRKHQVIKVSEKSQKSFNDLWNLGRTLVDAICEKRNKVYKPVEDWAGKLVSELQKVAVNIKQNSLPPTGYKALFRVPKGRPGSGIAKKIVGSKFQLHLARMNKAGRAYRGFWFLPGTDDIAPGCESIVDRHRRRHLSREQEEEINRLVKEKPWISWESIVESVDS